MPLNESLQGNDGSAPLDISKKRELITTAISTKLEQMGQSTSPFTMQEYLYLALKEGLQAFDEGNYGIGAVGIYTENGKQYIFLGHNRLNSTQNSSTHAEGDVLNLMEKVFSNQPLSESDLERVIVRDIPSDIAEQQPKTCIVTTVEPCPVCHLRMATHNRITDPIIDNVFIGSADPEGACVLNGWEDSYPKVWQSVIRNQLTQGHLVPELITVDSVTFAFVDEDYVQVASDLFFQSKDIVDQETSNRTRVTNQTEHLRRVLNLN